MKVAICSLGCKVNIYESEYVISKLKENGYEIVPFNSLADIYIINTCTVTNTADNKSEKMKLTHEQQNAYNKIIDAMQEQLFCEFLIYGITGSRKNRNIFTTNRRYYKTGEKQYNACARNFTYTTNSR